MVRPTLDHELEQVLLRGVLIGLEVVVEEGDIDGGVAFY